MDKLNPEWVVAIVTGVITFFGNKLWNSAKDKAKAKADELKRKIDHALAELDEVAQQLLNSATDKTTVAQMELWLKGAAAIQVAKHGLDPEHPLIKPAVRVLIAQKLSKLVSKEHTPPILDKLTGGK
jgi:hypothetical protein